MIIDMFKHVFELENSTGQLMLAVFLYGGAKFLGLGLGFFNMCA